MSDGINFVIEFDTSDIVQKVRAADRYIDRGLKNSVELASEKIAESAQKNHTFQNRTGDLEGSIHPDPVLAGHLDAEVEVIVGEDYASYVEKKLPYLQVAMDEYEPAFEKDLTEWYESAEHILNK